MSFKIKNSLANRFNNSEVLEDRQASNLFTRISSYTSNGGLHTKDCKHLTRKLQRAFPRGIRVIK
jgi:hypothetical protein